MSQYVLADRINYLLVAYVSLAPFSSYSKSCSRHKLTQSCSPPQNSWQSCLGQLTSHPQEETNWARAWEQLSGKYNVSTRSSEYLL